MDGDTSPGIAEKIAKKMSESEKVMSEIRECLKSGDASGLESCVLERRLSDQTIHWELTSELTNYITDDVSTSNPEFFEACEKCLAYLVKTGNAKEMILALLEQTECHKDDTKYAALLKLIQATLLKLLSKRFHSLDLALETLTSHFRSLELPNNAALEGEERILLDCDPNVVRIGDVVSSFLEFVTPFVEEVSLFKASGTKRKDSPEVLTLKKHLLSLLGYPLAYLDLTHDPEIRKSRSASRRLIETFMKLLVSLERDFHRYLEAINTDCRRRQPKDSGEDAVMEKENEENERLENEILGKTASTSSRDMDDDWLYETSVPPLAQACLSYLLHVEHLGLQRMPSILSQAYLLEFNLPYISCFLKRQEYLLIQKGVLLMQHFVGVLSPGSLGGDRLDNSAYMAVVSDIIAIMIHCPVKELRQDCVKILPEFIKRFDSDGRSKIVMMIIRSIDHPGVQGFVTQILKDYVDQNLRSEKPDKAFVGVSLDKVLKLLMRLPEGPATDLLEHSDRIIAVLNLLRFLVLRDKPDQNVTGIWTNFSNYEKTFLDPIRTGLDMSKAHYKLELTKVQKGTAGSAADELDMNVTVGGQSLAAMSKEQRVGVLQSALITFDMTESVLARLLELKDQQKAAHKN